MEQNVAVVISCLTLNWGWIKFKATFDINFNTWSKSNKSKNIEGLLDPSLIKVENFKDILHPDLIFLNLKR